MATVVLAGGGTAGHVEPALAVARQWMIEHPEDSCVFLGTSQGLENSLVPAAGFALSHIPKVRISRKLSPSWLRIPIDLLFSIMASKRIIQGADLVIGFGGYVSAPAYVAAKILRVPILIHEANAKPGWANQLGANFTPFLAVAQKVENGKFSEALLTGLPLKSDVAQHFESAKRDWKSARQEAKLRMGFDTKKPLVFVMGGSQGSIAINTVIAQSLALLESSGVNILHSVGKGNEMPAARSFYHPTYYVDSMADAYLAADLIICRSGAVTCSEFRALGRYALFIPLPVGNGEQFLNASSLVAHGRAEVVAQGNFTTDFIQNHLLQLLEKASNSPIAGDNQDIDAAKKIVALAQFAIDS